MVSGICATPPMLILLIIIFIADLIFLLLVGLYTLYKTITILRKKLSCAMLKKSYFFLFIGILIGVPLYTSIVTDFPECNDTPEPMLSRTFHI